MADFAPLPRPEPTGVTGARAAEDNLANRLVVDMQDKILLYAPNVTAFLTMTGYVKGSRTAYNVKYEWMEKDQKPRKLSVVGAQTDTDTTIEASANDVAKLANGDVLRNVRTGENILVSDASISAGDTDFTVVRNIGGGAAPMVDNDTLIILGPNYPDYSEIGTEKSIVEYANYNLCEIVRTPFSFTGRDIATEFYGGSDVDNETKWQAIEHKKSIEYKMYFGKRHDIAATGGVKRRTFMGGLDQAIVSNVWNNGGVLLTQRTIDEVLEEGLRWGKGGSLQGGAAMKYLLASARWMTELSAIFHDRIRVEVLDKTIGFSATEYLSPAGKVRFVHSPLLDEYYPGVAYLVDFNHVDSVVLRGRGTKLLRGRESNSRDGESYEYFSDVGLQVQFERAHMKWIL